MDGLAHERPTPIADVVTRRVEGDLHRCTGAELTARARRVANALAAAGVVQGDSVTTLAWNGDRHVELALACRDAGILLHSLDPRRHPDEIVRTTDDAGARILFFDLSFMPLVEEIALRLATVQRFVALTDRANMPGPATISNLLCYDDLVAKASDDGDRPAFGAGTADLSAGQDSEHTALRPEDVVLAAVPMFHSEGWAFVRAALAGAAKLVLPGPWLDGRSLHDLIEREGVTVAAADGRVWRGLLRHAERECAPLSRLRLALVPDAAVEARATVSTLMDRYGVTILHSPSADATALV